MSQMSPLSSKLLYNFPRMEITITMKSCQIQTELKNKQKTVTSIILSALLVLSVGSVLVPLADASHCNYVLPNQHCYAIERKTQVTYGNQFTTIISNLSVDCTTSNPNFATIEQWSSLPNGDWVEIGFADGYSVATNNCSTSEYTFTASRISGNYAETKHGSPSLGSTHVYEFSDTDKNKTWKAWDNTSNVKTITTPYANSIGADVGSELTQNKVNAVPKTHLYNILWYVGTSWANWNSADSGYPTAHAPYWILNCTPNYQHIHIGTSSFTQSCS